LRIFLKDNFPVKITNNRKMMLPPPEDPDAGRAKAAIVACCPDAVDVACAVLVRSPAGDGGVGRCSDNDGAVGGAPAGTAANGTEEEIAANYGECLTQLIK
jgi:hypothetical protein